MSFSCPNCSSSDTRKLSIIYSQGTSSIETTTVGVGAGTHGLRAIGAAHSLGTSQSELAKQLAPPKKKSTAAPFGAAIGAGLVFGVFGDVLYNSTFGLQGEAANNAAGYVLLAGFGLAFLGAIPMYREAKAYNEDTYPAEYAKWDRKYFCLRCANIFEPSAKAVDAPADPASGSNGALNASRPVTDAQRSKKSQIALGWVVLAGIALLFAGIGYSAKSPNPSPQPSQALNQAASLPKPATPPLPTAKPSFNCASAENAAEQMVCSNDHLASLDVQLASLYKAAREAAEDPSVIVTEQRQWVDERNACATVECLTNVYDKRVTELAAWVGPNQ